MHLGEVRCCIKGNEIRLLELASTLCIFSLGVNVTCHGIQFPSCTTIAPLELQYLVHSEGSALFAKSQIVPRMGGGRVVWVCVFLQLGRNFR